MGETYTDSEVVAAVGVSTAVRLGLFRVRRGVLVFDGTRPGPEWHAHGYFVARPWMVVGGQVERVRLAKRRWLLRRAGRTCHSRAPDTVLRGSFAVTVIVLVLWAWLDGRAGLSRYREPVCGLDGVVSPRTVQRWRGRAVGQARAFQHAVRQAVIERSEPRPVERLFPGGLSPPAGLEARRWPDPPGVADLWRGLALAIGGALQLAVPVTLLLAEARGRVSTHPDSFPL